MSTRRDPAQGDPDGDWFPPPWNEPAPPLEPEPVLAPPVVRERRQVSRTAVSRRSAPDVHSRRVLAISVPQAISGVVAVAGSYAGFLSGEEGTIPLAILAVLAIQLVGYAVARREEPAALRWSWMVCLFAGSVALSLLAVQVTLVRQPHAGTAVETSLPLVAATAASALLLAFAALSIAVSAHENPEEAGLLFLPLALLVPAVIGIPHAVTEARAVQALGESALLSAGASILAWSLPRPSRLLIPPFALAAQFVLLWVMGRGPTFPESSGNMVRLLQGSLLVLIVILVVALPILALWIRGAASVPDSRRRQGLPDLETMS